MDNSLAQRLKDAACSWASANLVVRQKAPLVSQEVYFEHDQVLRFDAAAYSAAGDFTVFEVKSSLADFSADAKYQRYLRICAALYFVFPKGAIPHDKIPSDCGILEAEEAGDRLSLRRHPYPRSNYSATVGLVEAIVFSDFFQRQLALPKDATIASPSAPLKHTFRDVFGSALAPYVPKELPPELVITRNEAASKDVVPQSLDEFLGD